MSDEFSKVFYNLKWVLNEEALKKSIDNSQDYLLAELRTRSKIKKMDIERLQRINNCSLTKFK